MVRRKTTELKKGDPLPQGYVWSEDDGLPARDQGDWAQQKLQFLDSYQGPALGATKKKRGETYYLDLFAGPGRNVSFEGPRQEFPGSPIRSLGKTFVGTDGGSVRFGGFYFFNVSSLDHEALEQRVAAEIGRLGDSIPREMARCVLGDTNVELPKTLRTLSPYAYLLAFADIEGPKDLPFDTLRELRRIHRSVDLYVLYPSDIGMLRPLAYDEKALRPYMATYDAYFGTAEWWEIWRARTTDAQARKMKRDLLALYMEQLRSLWRHVDIVAEPRKAGRKMYKMLFAYDHEAAGSIARSASGKAEQREFFPPV